MAREFEEVISLKFKVNKQDANYQLNDVKKTSDKLKSSFSETAEILNKFKVDNLNKQVNDVTKSVGDLTNNNNDLAISFLKVGGAAFGGFKALQSFVEITSKAVQVGFNFAVEMEKLQLAMTSVIYSTVEMRNANNELLTSEQKNIVSFSLASVQRQRLIQLNRETVTGLTDTIRIFTTMAPSLRKVGASFTDIERLTKLVANSSLQFTGTMQQVLAIVDGIGDGSYRANSEYGRFLNNLGVSTTKIKELGQAGGDVVGYLIKALEPVASNQDRLMATFTQQYAQFGSLIEQTLGTSAEGLKDLATDALKNFNEVLKGINFDKLLINSKIFFNDVKLMSLDFAEGFNKTFGTVGMTIDESFNKESSIDFFNQVLSGVEQVKTGLLGLKRTMQFTFDQGSDTFDNIGKIYDSLKKDLSTTFKEDGWETSKTLDKIHNDNINSTKKYVEDMNKIMDEGNVKSILALNGVADRKILESQILLLSQREDLDRAEKYNKQLIALNKEREQISSYSNKLEVDKDRELAKSKEKQDLEKITSLNLKIAETNQIIELKDKEIAEVQKQATLTLNRTDIDLKSDNIVSLNASIEQKKKDLASLTDKTDLYAKVKLESELRALEDQKQILETEIKVKSGDSGKISNIQELSDAGAKALKELEDNFEKQRISTDTGLNDIRRKYLLTMQTLSEEIVKTLDAIGTNGEKQLEARGKAIALYSKISLDEEKKYRKELVDERDKLINKITEKEKTNERDRIRRIKENRDLELKLYSSDTFTDRRKQIEINYKAEIEINKDNKDAMINLETEYNNKMQKLAEDRQKNLKKLTQKDKLLLTKDEEFSIELQKSQEFYDDRIEQLQKYYDSKNELDSENAKVQEAIDQARFQKEQAREAILRQQHLDRVNLYADGFGAMSELLKTFGSENKKAFDIAKAASIAEASMNMYVAASKAWAQGGTFGGIGAGIALAQGAVQIANINSQQYPTYHTGGFIDGRNSGSGLKPDEMNATLQTGEGVLSRRGMAELEQLNNGNTNSGNTEIIIVHNMEEAVNRQLKSRSGRAIIKEIK